MTRDGFGLHVAGLSVSTNDAGVTQCPGERPISSDDTQLV